jgi:GNAT superfamily N-acetyltransferase
VAVVGGTVVGTADMVVVENLTHGGRPWVIVENVVVDEAHRGEGVGKALMAEVVDEARRRDCFKVQLLSLEHRLGAHAFYRSLGFGTMAQGFRLYLD